MPAVPRSRVVLFLVLAALATAADLWSKQAVFSWLSPHEVYWLAPEHVGFQTTLNEGGLFGMGQGSQFWLAGFSILAAAAILVWLFIYRAASDRLLTVTLALVMGGILGNLYDRLGMHGLSWGAFDPSRGGQAVYAVRDFVLLAWKWDPPSDCIAWPNFNVADSFLVVGAGVLFLRALAAPSGAKPPIAKERASASPGG